MIDSRDFITEFASDFVKILQEKTVYTLSSCTLREVLDMNNHYFVEKLF